MAAEFFYDIEQRSEEWHELRLGIPTASEFDKILTPGGKTGDKPKISSQAPAYMHRLLAEWALDERLDSDDPFDSPWMERGREYEDKAVLAFEFQTGLQTRKIGIVKNFGGMAAASPDRLVYDGDTFLGPLEVKVPSPAVQMGYLLSDGPEVKYRVQHYGQMLICETQQSWIASYCPGFPLVIHKTEAKQEFLDKLFTVLQEFLRLMLQEREFLSKNYDFERKPKKKHRELIEVPRMSLTDEEMDILFPRTESRDAEE